MPVHIILSFIFKLGNFMPTFGIDFLYLFHGNPTRVAIFQSQIRVHSKQPKSKKESYNTQAIRTLTDCIRLLAITFGAKPAMISDAALYHSASHPDKVRLIFNTQLHQALKSIAKNRELVPVAVPHNANSLRPVLSLHDPYGGGVNGAPFGRSTELNGWDLEKKMVALQEVCDLLQRPFFFYADWATQAAATVKNAPVPLEKRMHYMSYFSKTLPLQLGQTTLLDLWYVCEFATIYLLQVPCINDCYLIAGTT